MKDIENKLEQLLKCEYGEMTIRREGKDYIVESPAPWSFWYRARLIGASGMRSGKNIGFYDPYELKEDGDGYVLTGQLADLDWEDEDDVELRFSGVEMERGNVRLEPMVCYARPWQSLAGCGRELLRKAEVAPELLNDREREILPLLRELELLTGCNTDDDLKTFAHLRSRFGSELHPYLDRIERSIKNWKKYRNTTERLLKRLNRIEYLPLWQSIRDEIDATQTEYPVSCRLAPELVRRIEEGLYSSGYSGSYPYFFRTGTIAQSREIKSYETCRWVRKGTPAVFHIRVVEQNVGQLQFLCGTELLKEGAQSLGLDSCGFDAKGRRYLRSYTWNDGDDLDKKLDIAVKKAELRKLSRRDREFGPIVWPLFFACLFGLGGFSAFCMTIGMVLVAGLVSFFLGGADGMWNILSILPYGEVFWFTLVIVGGTLGALLLLELDE